MSYFLGIDCSGVVAEMALIAPGGREFTLREDTPRQADVIFPMLDSLLSDAGVSLQHITAIGAVTGPGSFTGIRVALSMAQGLADGLGIPAYGLDGFAALALQDASGKTQESKIFVLESKRDELYVKYQNDVQMLRPEMILNLTNSQKTIVHNLGENSCFLPLVSCLSLAAARHARQCHAKKMPGKILAPYYVRDADAKPSAA